MALGNYEQTGQATGPTSRSVTAPSGVVEFGEVYSVPVAFTFSGSSFEDNEDLVVDDGSVFFTGACG
jgi:hypothetical protein